jgi:trans-aconitate 2-methyltransferase
MATPWDARTYDVSSTPQQAWASDVFARLKGIPAGREGPRRGLRDWASDGVPAGACARGRVLAIDASEDMVTLARSRLGDRAQVWCQDVARSRSHRARRRDRLDGSTALGDRPRSHGTRLAGALRPGGILEVQCGGEGNIARVREVIDRVAGDAFPELVGWSPVGVREPAGDRAAPARGRRCWLEDRPTYPQDIGPFVRTSILAAHLARLSEERRDAFVTAIVGGVRPPLDYVRLNVAAVRGPE